MIHQLQTKRIPRQIRIHNPLSQFLSPAPPAMMAVGGEGSNGPDPSSRIAKDAPLWAAFSTSELWSNPHQMAKFRTVTSCPAMVPRMNKLHAAMPMTDVPCDTWAYMDLINRPLFGQPLCKIVQRTQMMIIILMIITIRTINYCSYCYYFQYYYHHYHLYMIYINILLLNNNILIYIYIYNMYRYRLERIFTGSFEAWSRCEMISWAWMCLDLDDAIIHSFNCSSKTLVGAPPQ